MPETPISPAPEAPQAAKPLKATLNLPQTAFPMKAGLPINEPIRLKQWQDPDAQGLDLYAQIRKARAGSPRYILHDGPPYANGAIHLGHALNKCLKDFVVKTKTMAGFDAPYVPGWDCHGLPIEIKVDEQLGRKKLEMDPVAVRQACRAYAQKYLDLQRSQFLRMGIFGRWAEPYSTMDPAYEAHIAETFFHFFERGFVYKGLKPVFWCIHDRTALAEAEVEYEQHTSPSIYARYQLTNAKDIQHSAAFTLFKEATVPGIPIYVIIWTTTPWTLPASQAIAFNPDLEYVALATFTGVYLVAQALLSSVIVHCHLMSAENPEEPATQSDIIAVLKGSHLEGTTFQHPFLDRTILGVTAEYVTADQGTGAVHTAPAHGVDDFATGKRYDLPDIQFVDDVGRQMHTDGQPYECLTVFKSNQVITELLRERGALLAATQYDHSYPHCWRCHNPVIVRATEQWFIDMETPMPEAPQTLGAPGLDSETWVSTEPKTTFRQRALSEITRVHWDPSWGKDRITNMVATRPDWCISRQRIWGVPIAIFLCRKCSEPLRDPAINKMVVALFEKESADAWYLPENTPEKLLPADTTCKHCGHHEFRKEMDILDVWFESGASSHAVLDFDPDTQQAPNDPNPDIDRRADLYAEGGDQHRGWFMSSLLCNIGLHNTAPFKSVATYGWTLDEKGRALSKSLGNFIDPVQVMDQLGGDIVRLWVASVDFREDVVASLPLLKRLAEEIYRKLRNTFRFLLSVLADFDPTRDLLEFSSMEPLDQHLLVMADRLVSAICGRTPSKKDLVYKEKQEQLGKEEYGKDLPEGYLPYGIYLPEVSGFYSTFDFHRVYHSIVEFCNAELSAFYLEISKDRLYTFAPNAKPRRSAQSAIYKVLLALTKMVAPVLSFTADEVWGFLPKPELRERSVHLSLFPEALVSAEEYLAIYPAMFWPFALKVRGEVYQHLETARKEKLIGKGLDAQVFLNLDKEEHSTLEPYEAFLPELFNVSQVSLREVDTAREISVVAATGTKCDRCWRYTQDVAADPNYPTVCQRCAEALTAIAFPPYSQSSQPVA